MESMWRDKAIEHHITPIAQLLVDNASTEFSSIVFVGRIADGSVSVTASILEGNGYISYHKNFFDFADELKRYLQLFHSTSTLNGEDWKAIHLTVLQSGDFELLFEFDDAYRWDD